ncbi:MAG: NAD-dependent epimerase/dehydratase family protein [Patescibacteria group bacterium]
MADKPSILVTGGAGFIGSHLCERLLKEGNRVICIDNFATGHTRNIESMLPKPDFQFLRLDVNQAFDLEQFGELSEFKLAFNGIQEIYHLACPTSIKNFDQYKIQTLLCNSVGNYNVLEIAKKYRSKILLSSSSVVYGSRESESDYFDEDYKGVVDHMTPRACYDEGRRFSETMFETYRQVHGIETKIARIFRTYGPRMPLYDGHLIPDFIISALEGKDLVIFGDENFKTTLAYVTDVVDGLLRLMAAPASTGPVNIGSDNDIKISEVAQLVIDLTQSPSKIVYEEALIFLSQLGIPKIYRAKELGWIPLVRLEEGLHKTIDYMRANKMLLTSL